MIIGSKLAISLQRGLVDPKFQVEGVAPPTYHLGHSVRICTDFSSILSHFTRLTDRRTDRQTNRILIARLRLRSMQRGSNKCSI